jgi:formylglycine-generating enzyme required for sulfatase activity
VLVQKGLTVLFLAAVVCSVNGSALSGQVIKPQASQIFHDCSDCPNMVVIPAGNFLMGSSTAETQRDTEALTWDARSGVSGFEYEHPQHEVNINRPFAIGRYLVTRGEFAAFVRETGYAPAKGCVIYNGLWARYGYSTHAEAGWQNPGYQQTDSDPVVCVNWGDAQAYISWLNSKLHASASATSVALYRLPSESEWEYAARAGTRTARWWGDEVGRGNADCQGCGSRWDDAHPSPVGSFRANPFGLFDMLGSAWEWVEDCWHKDYVEAPTNGSAWVTAGKCERHVMRGGGFTTTSSLLRDAERSSAASEERSDGIGFRVVRTLPLDGTVGSPPTHQGP